MKHLFSFLFKRSYHLGFINDKLEDVLYNGKLKPNISWIKEINNSTSWFADPFIISQNSKYIEILAEEFEYANNKGRISHMLVRKDGFVLEKVTPVLDLDTHLSFPNYIVHDGTIYVYPENYLGGGIRIYEYDIERKKLINPQLLLSENLVDAQMIKIGNDFYIFGVKHVDDNYQYTYTKELFIYKSSTLFGEYKFFQKIINSDKIERGAGRMFYYNNKLFRPAQICNGGYGRGLIFFELAFNDDGYFVEKEVNRIFPGLNRYPLQLHTFNKHENLLIVDGYGYSNYYFGYLLSLLHIFIRKNKKK